MFHQEAEDVELAPRECERLFAVKDGALRHVEGEPAAEEQGLPPRQKAQGDARFQQGGTARLDDVIDGSRRKALEHGRFPVQRGEDDDGRETGRLKKELHPVSVGQDEVEDGGVEGLLREQGKGALPIGRRQYGVAARTEIGAECIEDGGIVVHEEQFAVGHTCVCHGVLLGLIQAKNSTIF